MTSIESTLAKLADPGQPTITESLTALVEKVEQNAARCPGCGFPDADGSCGCQPPESQKRRVLIGETRNDYQILEYCHHCSSTIEPKDLRWYNNLPYCPGCDPIAERRSEPNTIPVHECYFRRCRVCEKRFCIYETDVIDDGVCSLTCQQEEAGADSPVKYPYGISCHTQGGLPSNPRGQR